MNYIKLKRDKIDYCNICGQKKQLTWDHVPPKSSLLQADVIANTVFEGLPTEYSYMKHYQSGIKYRTICQDCNNVVLSRNDESYKAFMKSVADAIAKPEIIITAKINKILRAVCGHILAMRQE